MALVNYSSSDEELEDSPDEKYSILPNTIKQNTNENISVKSTDADGKIRRFPHERGNWASFVYIPYDQTELITKLQSKIILFVQETHDIHLKSIDEIHLSISKTVILKFHWIDTFVKLLRKTAMNFKKFVLELNQLKVYCNDDNTRTFIALAVDNLHQEQVKQMVKQVDTIFSDFNLPQFYDDPSFHVSILWCPGNVANALKQILHSLQTILDELIAEDCTDFQTIVKHIECKCGNKISTLPLS